MEASRLERLRLLTIGDKEDPANDDLLAVLEGYARARLEIIISRTQRRYGVEVELNVPSELDFILDEAIIKRFNRIGSEGMDSESIEGHVINFSDDDFAEFLPYIEDYVLQEDSAVPGAGKLLIY